MELPPRKRFDMSSLPKDKDALDKFIQSAPKEILFPIMLEVDTKEIRIICESKNKKVRDICNSKEFQKVYWQIHRRKLMQGNININVKDEKIILTDEKGNRLLIKTESNGRIKKIEYIANIGLLKYSIFLIKSLKGYKLVFPKDCFIKGPVEKEYSQSIERDWFIKDKEADQKGVEEFISEVKDVLKQFEYKGEKLSEYVKF